MSLSCFLFVSLALNSDQNLADLKTPISFTTQEISKELKIGYAVHVADVNADQKPDIIVVDKERVIWFENPTWKMHSVITGKSKADNVCLAVHDIDGDGKVDFVLGAGWKPFDTATAGNMYWLKQGKNLDEEWVMHTIPCEEPTVHRVQMAKIKGEQRIVMVPLMGKGATVKGNWTDGRPCQVISYAIPKQPEIAGNWKSEVILNSLNVIHNFAANEESIFYASYEGIYESSFRRDPLKPTLIHEGNQANPKSNRGASEIAVHQDKKGDLQIATIEPWHGNQVVVYKKKTGDSDWQRTVVDEQLRWGHAIKWADLNNDGQVELIAGVRDDPGKTDPFTEKRGVRIYRQDGDTWKRELLDEAGVAVEDLTLADLDNDGKPEIIAVGRATGNCRIYWNKTTK